MTGTEQTTTDPPVASRRRGRPRAQPAAVDAPGTRDHILAAAATLFAEQGYTMTTTRQIADVVGIRQASLYYHFADKGMILRSLLESTVAPSVRLAEWLRDEAPDVPARVRLCALVRYDVAGLLRDPWNLHVVFRLVDVAESEFEAARASQVQLREHYRSLVTEVLADEGAPVPGTEAGLDLVFGLVESLVSQRQWGEESSRPQYAEAIVRGGLVLAGVREADLGPTVEAADAVLAAWEPSAQTPEPATPRGS